MNTIDLVKNNDNLQANVEPNLAENQSELPLSIKVISAVYMFLGLLQLSLVFIEQINFFSNEIKLFLFYLSLSSIFLTGIIWLSVLTSVLVVILGFMLLKRSQLAWIVLFSYAVVSLLGVIRAISYFIISPLASSNFIYSLQTFLPIILSLFVAWELWKHRKIFNV